MSEHTESTTSSTNNEKQQNQQEQQLPEQQPKELLKNKLQSSISTTSSSSSTETTTIENEILPIIIDDKLNCDNNQNQQKINDIDEIILKIEETEKEKEGEKEEIIENLENNQIKCNGKLITTTTNTNDPTSPTKSILTNGTGPRKYIKKSVSFDPPDDEIVKKFTDGDVIVDKKNPFKNGHILPITDNKYINNNNISDNQKYDKKLIFHKLRKDKHRNSSGIQSLISPENDFVTTEDVLKESKYVKTYIKNPDKYFTYDPAVLAKIKFDELKELKDKKPPKEKKSSRLTQQTQQRLKELKNKYSPSSQQIFAQQQQPTKITKIPITKIPTFKKVSKANYPDLSDIKVKTGTDLEHSLFNQDEVTKNAKKFDERVKILHITSDDDLEEIDEPLTKSDSSDEIKSSDQIDSIGSILTISDKNDENNSLNLNNNSEQSGTFTNTVNSKEFQEYLDKKGLTLTPQHHKQLNGGSPVHLKSVNQQINKNTNLIENGRTIINKMEPKKVKKQSVFQRLLPSNIFSSKRKTTPKEPVPIPQSLYPKENGYKTSSNIKRVILERQSFHGSSGNSLNSSNDFKKHIERSRKSYAAGDDRSSSISSALTNAEDFPDIQSTDSILNGCKEERPVIKTSQVRSRSTSRERLQNLHSKSSNDSTIGSGNLARPKVQRASLPISALRPLPNKSIERNEKQQSNGPVRRSLERQSMLTKRPTGGTLNDDSQQQLQFGRSASMDRHEITKRTSNRLSSSLPKPSRNSVASQRSSIHTPKNSKEDLLDSTGPKITSTPNSDINGGQIKPIHKPLAPISVNVANDLNTHANYNVGIEEWTKLKEIKDKTDRELFNRIIHTNQKNTPNLPNGHIRQYENIYEKLPIEQRPQSLEHQALHQQHAQSQLRQTMSPIISSSSPLYAQLIPEDGAFIRGSPQRNTFNGVIRSNHRNAKIIDGTAINIPENQIIPIEPSVKIQNNPSQPPRCQSVLDEMLGPNRNNQLHQQTLHHQDQDVYGSVGGTPVIMRRKDVAQTANGSLSREEILQKVKDFCRKSMNKTPTKLSASSNSPNGQNVIANGKLSSDISPVSYASVEYHNNRGRITPQKLLAPQVPQRVQSLSSAASPQTPTSTSPIYAHVIKRNSVQSNASDIIDSPNHRISSSGNNYNQQQQFVNRPRLSKQISDTDSVFLPNGYLTQHHQLPHSRNQQQLMNQQQPQRPASATQFLVMDSDKVTPSHVMKFHNAQNGIGNGTKNNSYGQIMPSPYGYIQLTPQQQQLHRNHMDGRSTPLILERGVGGPQGSQIYWSPVQHHSPRPLHHSPVTKYSQQQFPQQQQINQQPQQHQQAQQQQQQQPGNVVFLKVKDQVYRPIKYPRDNIPQQQQQQQQQQQMISFSQHQQQPRARAYAYPYESESGSEAGEVQRIMQNRRYEEDWQNDKSGRNQSSEQATDDRRRGARREDPRRHTLGGDMLQYGSGQGQPQQRAMDLEMGTRAQKSKKGQPVRGYTPINQGPLFDEDPGIMSEVETASTGFRRGGKQRSSLPVVRTPSKTLERPLGLVFLQYRSETKRALLPNEITSIDTVRALFVRSFPRQLSMAYLEGPNVKIYIHDASKDMFYELEDVRSHLREIRDRSVLRLFESNEVAAPQVLPGGPGVPQPLPQSAPGHWDQDQSYFSEPEFDSEYQHQHIHKSSKGGKTAPYYVGTSQTLPRGMYSDRNKNAVGAPVKPLRSYGSRGSMGPPYPPYPQDQLYSIPDGYTSSPERGTRGGYEEPYYSQYGTRGATVVPMVGEEQRCDGTMTEDEYALYGMKVSGRIPRNANQLYDPTRPEDLHRIRVEHMERQLANLTGLVQKALVNQNPQIVTSHVPTPSGVMNPNYLGVPGQCRGLDDMDGHSSGSSTSIQDKSVSFEKSVSFSDDIQGVPKSHSPQHAADSKPPKPAIKSSTLPRTSSQERDRLKPPPPPKPLALAQTNQNYRPDIALAPEVYNHLRGLQKKAKDLRMEVRTLRRLSQAQAVAVREDIKDAFMRIRATLLAGSGSYFGQGDQEKTRFSREEELYKQEVIRLENDLSDLESSVEGLRGEVINRRTRVNMAAVEDMALVLSRASKTVAELKMRFPGLQNGLRNILSNEMEKVVREEKFLKEEPDRLESALRRCKKLTGTLVTLKRLASVQEQRVPVNEPINEDPPRSADISSANKPIPSPRMGSIAVSGGIPPENALDALLDELQTFAKPQINSDGRPDDSTSDDSSQTLHNTITTQLSQSSLYIDPANPNNPQNNPNGGIGGIINNINHNNILNNNQLTTTNLNSLRRLHSYPSGSDTDTSPPQPIRPGGKPPIPERNAELLSKVGNKRIPPPPPPRTSSRSPLASPTSPNISHRLPSLNESGNDTIGNGGNGSGPDGGDSSGNESGNDHVQRQLALEVRHQELLKKQKLLQEQYARLQQMSKNPASGISSSDILQLKKTGSESNLPQKMSLNMTVTGSMKNLNADSNVNEKNEKNLINSNTVGSCGVGSIGLVDNGGIGDKNKIISGSVGNSGQTTTNKVYETDIL